MNNAGERLDDLRDGETGEFAGHSLGDDPFDRLAEEFASRCRRGESPSVEEYVARHPEHATRLRELLPTVAMMEQLKRRSRSMAGKEPARAVPERLGEFRIVRELGRGGMGVVYEAVQEPLGRPIALKVIHQVHADDHRLLRFRREAMAVAQLHHTNIVPIFAVGEHEGLPYFAMQYIRGDSLDVVLGRWRSGGDAWRGPGRWRFAASVGHQAAGAIQHAHDQGVLHRDIKPANLLIDENEAVWVTDFGLAKLVGQDDLTKSGDVIGTLRYLAPEALQGDTGPPSDVYGLGLTLYEMLTLTPPFGDLNPSEMLQRVGEGHLPRPRALDPSIPRDLETIVLKAIAREPVHRYPTAGALADDLGRFLDDRPIRARRVNTAERVWRWSRRNRATAMVSGIAAGALLLAAVVGWIGVARTSAALAEANANLHQAKLETIKAEAAKRRADDNVRIPFDFIEELVDKIAAMEEARRRDPGPPGFGGPGPPPPPPEGPGGMGPMGRPGDQRATTESDFLQRIVAFYERMARRNETAPSLQGEAAWVFFKLGAHDERLGDGAKADQECDHALTIFEALADKHPDVPRYFAKLAMFPDMVAVEADDPSALARVEKRIRRIDALLARLAASADDPAYHRARMRGRMRLGQVLYRQRQDDRAEPEVRAAIDAAGAILAAAPENADARVDLIEARFALVAPWIERGRLDAAWGMLRESFGELQAPGSRPISSVVVAEGLEIFADRFRELGQTDRAEELQRQSDRVDPRPPRDSFNGPRGRFGGPRDRGPGPGGPRRRPGP